MARKIMVARIRNARGRIVLIYKDNVTSPEQMAQLVADENDDVIAVDVFEYADTFSVSRHVVSTRFRKVN